MKNKFKIIRVKADIHPDGDVYVKYKRTFYRIGQLDDNEEEHWHGPVPSPSYLKMRKIINK